MGRQHCGSGEAGQRRSWQRLDGGCGSAQMVFHGLVSLAISAAAAASAALLAAVASADAFSRCALWSASAASAAALISASLFVAASCLVLRSDVVLSSHSLSAGEGVQMVRAASENAGDARTRRIAA